MDVQRPPLAVDPVRTLHHAEITSADPQKAFARRARAEAQAAEIALPTTEELFRALADNISQLAWMADPTGSILVQPALVRVHGHRSR